MPNVVFTEADDGSSFHLALADLLILSLSETPTTGYRWELEFEGGDCLSVVSDHFDPDGIQPGAAGTRTISVKAKAACHARVSVRLRRAWDPQDVALRSVSITVTVD